jgi:hypothetical protein
MNNARATRLRDILVKERSATLNGEFDALNRIAKEKEKALTMLAPSDLSEEELRTISVEILRNQSIMESAIMGVKSAYAHIVSSKIASQQFSVYNRNGVIEVYDNRLTQKSQKY